jgi:hypothetical protein
LRRPHTVLDYRREASKEGRVVRHLAILAVPLIMTGCGIPPAVSIASYALDGVALVASGKTIKDHALSVAVGQDCSMFRVVSGEPICSDYEPNPAAAAGLAAMPESEEMLAATSDGRVIRVAAAPVPPGTEAVVTASAPAEDQLMTTRDGRVILVAATPAAPEAGPAAVVPPPVPAADRSAANSPADAQEDALLTTRDGRVILVAALPRSDTATPAETTVHLSWIAPSLEGAATQ